MSLLARREHSRQELVRKLADRGFGHAEIDDVLERLVAVGAQSDQRFAEVFVRQRVERGYGPLRIEYELRERGISPSLAREVLSEYAERWVDVARDALARRSSVAGDDTGATDWARIHRHLERCGFTSGVIRDVLKETPRK